MNKIVLNEILSRFGELTEADAKDMLQSLNEYPYSQVLHAVMARASRDLNHPLQGRYLSNAAIYSTDRNILKEIMDAPRSTQMKNMGQPRFSETNAANVTEQKPTPTPPLTAEKAPPEVPPYTAALPVRQPSDNEASPKNEVLPLIENTDTKNIEVEEIKTAEAPPCDDAYFEEIKKNICDDAYFEEVRKNMDNLQRSKLRFEEVAADVHPENWNKEPEQADRPPEDDPPNPDPALDPPDPAPDLNKEAPSPLSNETKGVKKKTNNGSDGYSVE